MSKITDLEFTAFCYALNTSESPFTQLQLDELSEMVKNFAATGTMTAKTIEEMWYEDQFSEIIAWGTAFYRIRLKLVPKPTQNRPDES